MGSEGILLSYKEIIMNTISYFLSMFYVANKCA